MSRCIVANLLSNSSAAYRRDWRAEKGGRAGHEILGAARLQLLPGPAERQANHRAPERISHSAVLENVRTETQDALIAFLEVDLDLSETILKTAEMAISPEHVRVALERVRQCIRVVRRLGSRIKDPETRIKIGERTDVVERRMNSSFMLDHSPGLQP